MKFRDIHERLYEKKNLRNVSNILPELKSLSNNQKERRKVDKEFNFQRRIHKNHKEVRKKLGELHKKSRNRLKYERVQLKKDLVRKMKQKTILSNARQKLSNTVEFSNIPAN